MLNINPTELNGPAILAAITAENDRLRLKFEIQELLSEAAVEIANLDCPQNIVCQRLRAMQRRLEPADADQPLRKFVTSESSLECLTNQRSQQTG